MPQNPNAVHDVCILHLGDVRYRPFCRRQAFSLRDAGYRVALVSWEQHKGDGDPHWQGVDVFPLTLPVEEFRGKRFFLQYMASLTRLLLRLPARLYQADDPVTVIPARLAAGRHRTRYNYLSLEYFQGVDLLVHRPLRRLVWGLIESTGLSKARNAATVCQSAADRLAARFKIPTPHVIYNVPCTEEFAAQPDGSLRTQIGISSRTPLVIYKGDLSPARGLVPFLMALRDVAQVHFVLLGAGAFRAELENVVRAAGLESRVHFLGPVLPERFPRLLKEADLGHALHERVGLNMPYTLPAKLFDYLHAALPVLCGDTGEMARIVGEHCAGWTANPDSVDSIVASLREFVAEYDGLDGYRRRARAAAQRYCWEIEQVSYLRWIREALGEGP